MSPGAVMTGSLILAAATGFGLYRLLTTPPRRPEQWTWACRAVRTWVLRWRLKRHVWGCDRCQVAPELSKDGDLDAEEVARWQALVDNSGTTVPEPKRGVQR